MINLKQIDAITLKRELLEKILPEEIIRKIEENGRGFALLVRDAINSKYNRNFVTGRIAGYGKVML